MVSKEVDLLIEKTLSTGDEQINEFNEEEMFDASNSKPPYTYKKCLPHKDAIDQCLKRKDSLEIARKKNILASKKSHKDVSDMISVIYETLPNIFLLHHSFSKLSKIQKLDQIQKFLLSVQKHGYKAD